MPSTAACGPSRATGVVTPLHGSSFLNCESGMPLAWQYGNPKFSPALETRFSSSSGPSSPIQSRPLSVNHSSPVFGCQSNPIELRMPRAITSMPDPIGVVSPDLRVFLRWLADVARRPERDVQLLVRPERE